MTSPPNNRRYSEEEIQAIFRRATERQEAADTADPHRGLTLEELKAIGAESGIDPAHVEAAVADLERGHVARPDSLSLLERFYGLSATIRVERVLPGTMEDATWNDAVDILRSVFNTRGQDEWVGPIREWSAFTSSGFDYQALMQDDTWYTLMEGLNLTSNTTRSPVHVEARPEGDRTRIIATYEMPDTRLWEAPGIAGSVWLVGLVMGLVYLFGSLPATFLFVPLGFLLLGGLFGAWQRHAHRTEIETTHQRIDKALDRIGYLHAATSDAPEQSTSYTAAHSAEAAPLDEDAEDEAPSSTESAARRRTRS
jgi:hypothetical protein